MATDFISRDAAIKELCAMCQNIDQDEDKDRCWCIPKDRFNQIPTADVRPVDGTDLVGPYDEEVYGLWWKCDKCGENGLYREYRYCPYCGRTIKSVEEYKEAKP